MFLQATVQLPVPLNLKSDFCQIFPRFFSDFLPRFRVGVRVSFFLPRFRVRVRVLFFFYPDSESDSECPFFFTQSQSQILNSAHPWGLLTINYGKGIFNFDQTEKCFFGKTME